MVLELAVIAFDDQIDAERAMGYLEATTPEAPWLHELALTERARNGRITIRGTFAGHFLDVEPDGEVIGHSTAIGALTGAILGAALGPPGLAAGFVAGGSIGGYLQSRRDPAPQGELFEQIRVHVPRRASALVLLADESHVDALIRACRGLGGHAYRLVLTEEQADVLTSAVSSAPVATW